MFNKESTRLVSALQRGLERGDICELIGNSCECTIDMFDNAAEDKLLCAYFGESCIDHSPIFILEDNKLVK